MNAVFIQSCVISGGVGNKRAEDNKAKSPRILKEGGAGGDSSTVRDKRNLDKPRSKFDALKGTESNGRRSYSSNSQAKSPGTPFIYFIKPIMHEHRHQLYIVFLLICSLL